MLGSGSFTGEEMQPAGTQEASHPIYSSAERAAIREQLDRMLASPLFKNSKRYPNLLRYIVEQTLEGTSIDLKERTLGIEVFGRAPGYDTNADPIVRATASELRKRIAQYYHEDEHQNETRIDLSPGSYVPEFRFTIEHPAPTVPSAPVAVGSPRRIPYKPIAIVAASVAVAIAAWAIWWPSPTALDQFWAPVLGFQRPALLCVGQRTFRGSAQESLENPVADIDRFAHGQNKAITLFELYYLGSQNLALTDATTLGNLTGLLQSKHKPYEIRGQSSTTFSDLRHGPVILIGAFNNDWTLRLMGPMRFSFEREGELFWIKDQQRPNDRSRAVNYSMPYLKLTEDYALISRVLDPSTDRPVMVAAGLTGYGTLAAGEFLSNTSYMEALAKGSPRDWQRKNIQILIATKVINGNSGPPRVIEKHIW